MGNETNKEAIRNNLTAKTEILINDLTANTDYTVTVVAFNEVGEGGNVTGTGRTKHKGLGKYCRIII